MNDTLRSILFVIVGLIIGGIVNMGIVTFGPSIIPPPEGVDTTTVEGLAAGIHLFEFKHFIMPFLAHALGTFTGAYIAARFSKRNKLKYGLVVGFVFLLGGIMIVISVPSPLWFNLTDLFLAYIPMAWLAAEIAIRKTNSSSK